MNKTLEEVLEESDINLIPSSNDRLVAICPFHEGDREPSFTVYPDGGYYCFGCKVWGDVVKFLVDYKGMAADEALAYAGIDYKQPKTEKSKIIKVKNTLKTWEFLYTVASQYHQFLLEMPGALNYLQDRGLTNETINKYMLGYSDGSVLNLQFAYERQLADEIGIMTRKGFETMSHRITIPNLLDKGQCDFIMGRTVINDRAKYLGARMPKPLTGFYEIRHSPVIFIVEGQFDWLTLRQWGYPAICISGTNLKSHASLPLYGKDIIVVPDIDDGPGMKAANDIKNQFGEKATILDISVLRTKAGKLDVNTLAMEEEGEQLFKNLLVEQVPWISFLSRIQSMKWLPKLENMKSSLLI